MGKHAIETSCWRVSTKQGAVCLVAANTLDRARDVAVEAGLIDEAEYVTGVERVGKLLVDPALAGGTTSTT